MNQTQTELVAVVTEMLRLMARDQEFRIDVIENDPEINLIAFYSSEDHPRVVGKQGAIILAIKRILDRLSESAGEPLHLKLLDPPRSNGSMPRPEFHPRQDWPQERITECLAHIVEQTNGGRSITANHMDLATIYYLPRATRAELARDLDMIFRLIGRSNGRMIEVQRT